MKALNLFLLAGAFGLAPLVLPQPAWAQCYPGLACPTQEAPANASPDKSPSQGAKSTGEYHYVGPVLPPDQWLSLRTVPSDKGGARIMKMPEGTLLRVTERRDKWWYVQLRDGTTGWAHSDWIRCCKQPND